jgi:hypothetical protein
MHIYPAEFAVLVTFLFLPPLLLALGAQIWFAHWKGQLRLWRLAMAFLFTTALSLIIGFTLDQFTPKVFSPVFRLREGFGFPVLPLAFFSVALAAPIVTFLVFGRGRKGV